jgi:hypothetical protein
MKRVFRSIILGLFLPVQIATLSAQIRDNESSANALAIQCAVSSVFSAEDYEEYCRRLAKTIGMLDSAQQKRVFGFLPMAGSGGEGTSETSGDSNTSSPRLPAGTEVGTVGEKTSSNPAGSSTGAGIPSTGSGGSVGTTSGTTATGGTPTNSTSTPGSSSWDALIQWFRGAQAAYESGTLSTYLKGNQN